MSRLATLSYRVRRKLGRALRRRLPSLYERWDRMGLRSALPGRDPREVLLDFAELAPWAEGEAVHPPVEEWADAGFTVPQSPSYDPNDPKQVAHIT